MKFIKGYLVFTSVIFHLALAGSLYWIMPLYDDAIHSTESLAESIAQESLGTVTDKSEITRGNLTYTGYSVKFEGSNLYLTGTPNDEIEIGEQVQIITYEHLRSGVPTLFAFATRTE